LAFCILHFVLYCFYLRTSVAFIKKIIVIVIVMCTLLAASDSLAWRRWRAGWLASAELVCLFSNHWFVVNPSVMITASNNGHWSPFLPMPQKLMRFVTDISPRSVFPSIQSIYFLLGFPWYTASICVAVKQYLRKSIGIHSSCGSDAQNLTTCLFVELL